MDQAESNPLEPTADATAPARPWWRWLDAGEFVIALLLLAAAAYLRVDFARHAGPLWRDEANSVGVATLPSLADVYARLEFDSFPMLWMTIQRYWILAGLGRTDAGLRALGLIVALALLPALWWTGRQMGFRPVTSLLLLGLAPTMIRWGGGANRAYGLGALLLAVLYGLMWRVATRPTRGVRIAAAIVAVLAVHTLYYNAVVVLALCSGAAIVAARGRGWRAALPILGIGAIAAASMLVYVPVIARLREWAMLIHAPIDARWLAKLLVHALGPYDVLLAWVWGAALIVALVCGVVSLFANAGTRDAALFASVTLLVGCAAHALFLLSLRYPTEPWYYVTPIALAALSIDALIASATRSWTVRILPAALAGVIAIYLFPGVHREARTRMSNVDRIAAHVSQHATESDYIVLDPWYIGVTFNRYYTGGAPWTTSAPIGYYRFHRYDIAKQLMQDPQATRPVRERIEQTLRSGGRVWFVGRPFSTGGAEPAPLPPAPHPQWKWNVGPYTAAWGTETMHVILTRAATLRDVTPPNPERISPYEDPPLFVAEGWKD